MENIALKCELQNFWLGAMINAIYVHFWLPRMKKKILWNPIPEKYVLYNHVVLEKLG